MLVIKSCKSLFRIGVQEEHGVKIFDIFYDFFVAALLILHPK